MEKLNSTFFYHLERSIKSYRQYAQTNLINNGFSITIDQWLVLKSITDNPNITQAELSKIVFKDKASVTRIIELLVKNNYLSRAAHPQSRRRHELTITEKGLNLIKDILPTIIKNRKTALENITENEILIAEKVLKTIVLNCTNETI